MTTRDEALEVALGVGLSLAGEAIWHEDRCNWLGRGADPEGPTPYDERAGALDPYPYEGTSGVALFLAELHAATGDDELRRAALGAVRHALRAAQGSDTPRVGLYDGDLGIAVVAARLARILGEPELAHAAALLVAELPLTDPEADRGESDLLVGAAGTAVGLLTLAELLDQPELAVEAAAVGDRVLMRGEPGDGVSWPSPHGTARRNLTGLAHGAAGIAHALLVLGDATGRRDFAGAAEGAFRYERSVFDERARNWPDFRAIAQSRTSSEPSFAAFWCHGGPGIALTRLAALDRSDDDEVRRDAEAGLAVAREAVSAALRHGGGNFSLCHGLAGNAEILLEGARVLGDDEGEGLALAAAAHGAERHAEAGDWPSGLVSHRQTPGLMLGRAGTGHFYLRLARPSVPSVLLPTPPKRGVFVT